MMFLSFFHVKAERGLFWAEGAYLFCRKVKGVVQNGGKSGQRCK